LSTSAAVAAAWNTAIWQHATITSITEKIHAFDIADSESEYEDAQLRFQQEINFIQYLVVRASRFGESAGITGSVATHTYTVQVIHVREAGTDGANWAAVRNFFETLFGLVVSELGTTWAGTVDLWKPQEGPPRIDQISIDNTPCWRGLYEFSATRRVNL